MNNQSLDEDTRKLANALFLCQSKSRKTCIDSMNKAINFAIMQAVQGKNFDALYKILRSFSNEKLIFLKSQIRMHTPVTFDKSGKIKLKKSFVVNENYILESFTPFSDVILDFDENSDIFKLDRKTLGVDEMYSLIADGLVFCRNKFSKTQLEELYIIFKKIIDKQNNLLE